MSNKRSVDECDLLDTSLEKKQKTETVKQKDLDNNDLGNNHYDDDIVKKIFEKEKLFDNLLDIINDLQIQNVELLNHNNQLMKDNIFLKKIVENNKKHIVKDIFLTPSITDEQLNDFLDSDLFLQKN